MENLKYDVTQKFDFEAKHIGGVAFDGKNVWVSFQPREGKGSLLCLDRTSGAVLREIASFPVGTGTAWDGAHIWQIGDGLIHCVDPETGSVLRTIPLPAEGFCTGLAFDGECLWVGSYEGRRMYKIDRETGKVLHVVESDRFVTGITWVNDELWHAADSETDKQLPTEIRSVSPQDGAVRKRAQVPFAVSGLSHDGCKFWCGDCEVAALRAVALTQ